MPLIYPDKGGTMGNYKFEEFKKYINGRKAAVIGIGISNTPLIKWLISLGADVTACDKNTEEDPVLSGLWVNLTLLI